MTSRDRHQQNAYVLHRRPYRNNSYLIEFFTQEQGIVSTVCKGMRSNRKQQRIVSFMPLWLEYSVRGQLATLHKIEPQGTVFHLSGNPLFCGLYLNELLLRLLGKHDAYPELFLSYQQALQDLADGHELEPPLRRFELRLLSEIGYGISFHQAANTSLPIDPQKYYYYEATSGFNEFTADLNYPVVVSGAMIAAIAQQRFEGPFVLQAAKQILRTAINHLLGKRALNSRQLFITRGQQHDS